MLVSINHLQLIIYTGLLSEVLVDDTFPTIFEDYVISGRSLNLQNELVFESKFILLVQDYRECLCGEFI